VSQPASSALPTAASQVPFDQARAAADRILAHPEFRTVAQESALQREINRIAQWINDLFTSVASLGQREPWLAPLIEWSFFSLAAAALLIWGFRTMQRQRLTVLLETAGIDAIWRKESDDWAALARAQAAALDWREAIHSLYWATIVMLEGRKLWRPNRARTPREYLRLLEPGSPRQTSLGGLTRIFERIWYGQRPASENDYARVRALFEELDAAG
jgi:hypothetical protein